MTILTGSFTTYPAKGIRESLSNVIYNISPEEVPFMSNSGRGKAPQTFNEWQLDSLAAPGANAQLEGDNLTTYDAVVATVRVGNRQQISRKSLSVSGTEEVVVKAGRDSELGYQTAKKSAELKRDMEGILVGSNTASVAGSTTVARLTGSLLAFIFTNTDKGATGVDPVYTTEPNNARTDGTQRPFTETLLKNVIVKVWTSGGKLDTLMVGATQKVAASAFAGIATKTYQMTKATTASIIGAADIYVSDFGTLTIVPNRFMRARDALLLDFEYIEIDYLRPFFVKELATTGDATNKLLIAEYGLKVKNEAALGLVADLT